MQKFKEKYYAVKYLEHAALLARAELTKVINEDKDFIRVKEELQSMGERAVLCFYPHTYEFAVFNFCSNRDVQNKDYFEIDIDCNINHLEHFHPGMEIWAKKVQELAKKFHD